MRSAIVSAWPKEPETIAVTIVEIVYHRRVLRA
jgi:hypothetical protein